MKKYLPTILTLTIILIIVGGIFFMPEAALAVTKADNSTTPSSGSSLVLGVVMQGMNNILAYIANAILTFDAWALTICGTFLSISINITTHIQQIFFSKSITSSIETVWVVVRDLSSIFIIFSLLYYSILTILGQTKTSLNQLIAKIFLAGILINFSLFFVKVAVDASNLVSLQFYNAIAPQTSTHFDSVTAYYDGGLSNIFMQSLKLPKIYNVGVLKGTDVTLSILVATVGGIIMMSVAACSFLAAALAFTIRTGILLFIMALSPLYFAGMIFPQIQTGVSDKLLKALKGQLIFMPVYLFLLYISLRFISDPSFLDIFQTKPGSGVTEGVLGSMTIGVILQYTIAIIFINVPLGVAMSLGGKGMKWAPQAGAITSWFRTGLKKNVISRAASKIADSETMKDYAARNGRTGQFLLSSVRNTASDYNKKLDEQVSAKTKFGESLGHNLKDMNIEQAHLRRLNAQLATLQAGGQPTAGTKTAIGIAKQRITDLENKRKGEFATNVNTRSADTLFTMRARKNKVAAAKLQIPIVQDQIDHHKEDLKGTKADLKQLQQAITNNPGGVGTVAIPGVNGLATAAQQTQYNKLLGDQLNQTNDINAQETLLADLKLIK